MATTARLSFTEKLAYGLGDTASNFYFQFFNLFLVNYYTDIFGLLPATVGTMIHQGGLIAKARCLVRTDAPGRR